MVVLADGVGEGWGMDAFFAKLGCTVLEQWKRVNFSLERFPGIACAALEERPPATHVDLKNLMRGFLLDDDQPMQTQSGFGQPELVAYDHPRFYIQVLFWLDGTTDIHQHEFSGAFHVMHGSSIHAHYNFEHARPVTPHFRLGNLRMRNIELLEMGRTVPIVSGPCCIHSLFHLDTPSVTVVVRTQHDPGTGPQFNYLPPHIAMDPVYHDALTMRRKQLLAVLEQSGDPAYPKLVREMIAELDFERGFFILQDSMGHLRDLGAWDQALSAFRKKHGRLAAGVAATLEENVRRDVIKDLRIPIAEPEHRFFLALLMHVSTPAELLKLVGRRFPDASPLETVLRWAGELMEVSDCGISVLDAEFPLGADGAIEAQPYLIVAALRQLMQGGRRKLPADLPPPLLKKLRSIFAASSLRVLID